MSSPPPPLAPLQVLPASYEEPRKRPPGVTTLGVLAIVIGSVSMFASATVGMIALGFMIRTQMSKTFVAATTTTTVGPGGTVYTATSAVAIEQRGAPTTAGSTPSPYPTGPRGLNEPQRQAVRDVLHRSRPMSDAQAARLDQLLAKAGKDIVPTTPGAISVSEHGTLGADQQTANYYMIGSGKIELYEDRGVFDPDESGETIRVWADQSNDDDPSNDALTAKQIDELLVDAQRQANDKLTPQQLAALKNELSDPNQTLVLASAPRQQQRLRVSMLPDGNVSVVSNGFIQIDPAGNVTNPMAAAMAGFSSFAVRPAATTMTLLDSVLAGGLAIYLLIVGILVLKQHRRGRGMQLAFAWLKIPIAIMAAIGWIWTIQDANAGALASEWLTFWFVTFLVVGLTYPLMLLIVLRTRTVKQYYEGKPV